MNIPYNQFEQLYYESSVFKQSNLSVLHYCSSHNSMLKHLTFSYSDSYEKIIDIFCGFRQSFLITDKNRILCSGYNKNNELGLFGEGICRKLEKNDFFMNLGKIIKISTGQKFTIFQIESNLYGVGDNKYGQLILNEKKVEKITK